MLFNTSNHFAFLPLHLLQLLLHFAAEKLYVYNWTDYVPSNLVAEFTKETGIEVIYSTFESNEEMYAKLKLTSSTGSGYDLVSHQAITSIKWRKKTCYKSLITAN